MNTRIALSTISILAALTVLSGATYAAFSDVATSQNNTFTTGNADLQIALDNNGVPGTYANTVAGPTFNNLFPGQSKTYYFWLKNNSSAAIGLDLTADVSAIAPTNDTDQAIDNALLVSWTCDTDRNNSLGDNSPTSEFSPRDWLNGGNATLGNLPVGTQMFCSMTGRLPNSADSTVANQTVAFDVAYNAAQAP